MFAALYLITVSVLAGFWGQFFVRKLVAFLGRASVIVFILSGVIFASALTMGNNGNLPQIADLYQIIFAQILILLMLYIFISGIVGTEKSIEMIHNHEFMGFLGFCST